MGFHRGPNIITNNLKFVIDAASVRSYPGSGNEIFDVISNNDFDTSGPTYNSTNFNGAFEFDGTNDIIRNEGSSWIKDNFVNNQAFTIGSFFKPTSGVGGNTRSALYANQRYKSETSPGGFGINILNQNYCMNLTAENAGGAGGTTDAQSFEAKCYVPYITGSVTYITYTWDGVDTIKGYRDGELVTTDQNSSYQWTTSSAATNNQRIGTSTQGGWGNYFEMDWYNLHVYGNDFSLDEIQQNYNALKSRFGL